MYQTSRLVGPLLLILSVVVGCSRKRVSPTPAAAVDRAASDDGSRRDSIAGAEAARRDSLAREASLREAHERRLAEARAALAAPVYFAYDRSDLSIEIVSFGEERPTCSEDAEGCWSRNRRVEFEIVAGADLIVVRQP